MTVSRHQVNWRFLGEERMELDSVRALKREVLENLVGPTIVGIRHASTYSVAAKSLAKATGVVPTVALGITKGKTRKDFKLAVRLQQRSIETQVAFRNGLEQLARGEVDIQYVGRIAKQQGAWHTSRQRPLLIGASVGHFAITAGTIGAFPTLRKTGKRVLLSNNHVLANENRGKAGDAILQAGVLDGGTKSADTIGGLADFVPLKQSGANMMDAAIADLDQAIDLDAATLTGAPQPALKGMRAGPLDIGDEVFKLGRTTGLTRGQVSAIEMDDVVVDYEIGSLRFDRQIEIEGADNAAFSEGGDSGSLIVDRQGFAAALLFAGTDQGGTNGRGLTYATDLSSVFQTLDLKLEI
jgi:hypothetical protein